MLKTYSKTRKPIEVSFRTIVPQVVGTDRYSHLIHPYPAKLLAHIPFFFLSNSILSQPGDTVLDPFCGSGTVLLESMLANRHAVGTDANPLARLIAEVKTTDYECAGLTTSVKKAIRRIKRHPKRPPPDSFDVERWFYPHVTRQLSRIAEAIDAEPNKKNADFLKVCFSATLKHVSRADPRLSVPVRLRVDQYPKDHWLHAQTEERLRRLKRLNVIEVFRHVTDVNLDRVRAFHHEVSSNAVSGRIIGNDARQLPLSDNSTQLIITSPPYAGAQKYIRASSLSLGWLGYLDIQTTRELESMNIGREHFRKSDLQARLKTGTSADPLIQKIRGFNPLRAHLVSVYLMEMEAALREMHRVLDADGFLVLVAANNQVCQLEFETQKYLVEIACRIGFCRRLSLIDSIRSRGLMTSRNKTAGIISREWVHVLQKCQS